MIYDDDDDARRVCTLKTHHPHAHICGVSTLEFVEALKTPFPYSNLQAASAGAAIPDGDLLVPRMGQNWYVLPLLCFCWLALACTVLAVLPTMCTPEDGSWDRDVVYKCMWHLLAALDRWNRRARAGDGSMKEEEVT
ncbi:hypothetical protein C8Q80DRAFT_1175048 [Daedaleopsis nitida]|nr:hypothetical protein C8Q80DRAFT_1175048 [Daedaleopsis nitida]